MLDWALNVLTSSIQAVAAIKYQHFISSRFNERNISDIP